MQGLQEHGLSNLNSMRNAFFQFNQELIFFNFVKKFWFQESITLSHRKATDWIVHVFVSHAIAIWTKNSIRVWHLDH